MTTHDVDVTSAIVTTYHGLTNHRGARITARLPDGGARLTIDYPHHISGGWAAPHHYAAEQLRAKLAADGFGWSGHLIGGYIGGGRFAWICRDGDAA